MNSILSIQDRIKKYDYVKEKKEIDNIIFNFYESKFQFSENL